MAQLCIILNLSCTTAMSGFCLNTVWIKSLHCAPVSSLFDVTILQQLRFVSNLLDTVFVRHYLYVFIFIRCKKKSQKWTLTAHWVLLARYNCPFYSKLKDTGSCLVGAATWHSNQPLSFIVVHIFCFHMSLVEPVGTLQISCKIGAPYYNIHWLFWIRYSRPVMLFYVLYIVLKQTSLFTHNAPKVTSDTSFVWIKLVSYPSNCILPLLPPQRARLFIASSATFTICYGALHASQAVQLWNIEIFTFFRCNKLS